MINTHPLLNYAKSNHDIKAINQWRSDVENQLQESFENGQSIRDIILARSNLIDEALQFLWQHAELDQTDLALFAVGGYGRREMLPYSDVDIMILSEDEINPEQEQLISTFISSLWDVGNFKPGISVRTINECVNQASSDMTVATTLIEARLIIGNENLCKWPRRIVSRTWTDKTFFDAKMDEQHKRYAQHNNTESNLEPDIKNAPGGIRDINQIGWIAKRHFRVNRIYDLVHLGFISEFELGVLEEAESFLWEIRHHLHRLTKRDENRLLFDYQRDIAAKFGYVREEAHHPNYPIEQFMKRYYRSAQQVSTLNEMLLAYFNESVITPRLPQYERQIEEINQNFKLVDGKLAVQHHKIFSENPNAILEIFYLLANRPEIEGIRARTLRLLTLAGKRIDQDFRDNPVHQALFMAIIRSPHRLYDTMVAMKRYGVLGNYIPAFGQILGLMQYDLFHIYTVDAHTLLLLRNLNRFKEPEFAKEFPVVSSVFQRLTRRDIVYLAAIFHDIAKGRGGDHSELGASDAIKFCRSHGFTERESNLVAWLIQNHLMMSVTAQKKDISDPDVVKEFAEKMGDMEHLDYLYTLTVADINATNPKLWNTWRASLMRQLYTQARDVIRSGLGRPVDYQMLIEDTKFAASELLVQDFSLDEVEKVWQELGDDYFLKETADEIAWHTRAILQHGDNPAPLVLMRAHRKYAQDAVQIFIYTQDQPNLFATTVAILDRMNLDVQDARIITATKAFSLDTYVVLDRFGTLLTDPEREATVIEALKDALSHSDEYPGLMQRRIPRQLRHFDIENTVDISINPALNQNMVEIATLDHPGLLAKIGGLFMMQGLDIHSAKIATLGERAEDIFFVTKKDGNPMTPEESAEFAAALKTALDEASHQVCSQHSH
ncbi:[protein-PII] uridylyltransferase [Acinetobacter lwoffii]|jgi:[protein-PII] uridylyltransferase|uniref:Bifunctional uridylyltransferase/uridylyl-removing enzyme n=1 Tax=Acinetobacter lwoffii TaxID=28090 RepID=A0A646MLZ8_ACILW|nr:MULTISPECIES: [protein-PII] uridylyltransferase [Pseudomonadota]ENW29494.1 [protein-PII] uridylyltransferase [Acinetobacter lwoffii ATCC 9957 = CIP 70.31]MDP1317693.1 [protein-PII] uridylyltransferase [Acinetobacter lwoffii]MRA03430.1 [protein-PII] uridylyltransferase [Acinetobacter lwoffii]QKU21207.1 [protein-PII] uridylyltransferase [Acinetobacter lwoffii]SPJ19571.1 Bifunctional uridylyltransferase/uridylyl-removing enzyme [Prolinoborus fasciculus]